MHLLSLATAVPPYTFTQPDCWERIRTSPAAGRLRENSLAFLRKILLGANGIERRAFAIDDLEALFEYDSDQLHQGFSRHAPSLAEAALRPALEKARLAPADLDALFVCTCTGYLCPGLSSYLAQALGLPPDRCLQDLVGLGCGAAIPTMRAASNFLAAHPGSRVATVAVEICSAAFYLDDDPGVLISACLFADGAAAALWSDRPGESGLCCHGFDTLHLPENRECLRFEQRGGKLRNKLDRSVPGHAAAAVARLYEGRRTPVPVDAILSHTGGRDVIEALREKLPESLLREETTETLRRFGNLSSPSILFTLEQYLNRPAPVEETLWLVSFGAGMSAHSCHLLPREV